MLWSCKWWAPLRGAAVAAVSIPLFLGFGVCSDTALSAEPAAPAAAAETPLVPQWLREALDRLPPNLRKNPAATDRLEISRSPRAAPWTGEELELLAGYGNLKHLLIYGSGFARGALDRLKEVRGLERLAVYCAVTDSDLKALADLPGLKSLVLRDPRRLTETGTKHLSESRTLEEIEFPYAYHPDVALVRPLGGMRRLKLLRLYTVSPLTEAKMAVIAELKSPAALDLSLDLPRRDVPPDGPYAPLRGMPNIQGLRMAWQWPHMDDKDAALALIESLTNLKRLDLSGNNIPDADYARLAGLVNLRELNLARTSIRDAGFARLRPLVRLEKLNLAGGNLTDASRTVLRYMTAMRDLNLCGAGAGISDATVGVVAGFHGLERLIIGGNVGSPAVMARLADLKNLKYLNLSGAIRLNDEGLAHVGKFTSLEELQINYLPWPSRYEAVTDKGVRSLAGLKNLRKLGLVGCNVTIKATKEALKDLKGLEITFTGEKPFQEYETLTVGAEDARP